MKIRKAKKEDIEKIWEIEKESREHHTKISQTKYKRLNKSKTDKKAKSEFEKNLEKDINGKKIVFLVAENDILRTLKVLPSVESPSASAVS